MSGFFAKITGSFHRKEPVILMLTLCINFRIRNGFVLEGQGNQEIVRRRTLSTSHKQFRRLTQRLRNEAVSDRKFLHVASVLPPHLKQRLRNLTQGANLDRVHEFGKYVFS